MNIFLGLPVSVQTGQIFRTKVIENNPQWKDQRKIRWTLADNYHLTMHFFGPIKFESLSTLSMGLSQYIQTIKCFTVNIIKLHNFPRESSKLIAAYIQLNPSLNELYNSIQQAVKDYEFPVEERAFSPHITLCRANRSDILQMQPLILENFTIKISSLVLYQSIPGEFGSLYIPLQEWSLI